MVNHIHIYAEDKTHILYSRICFICSRNNTFGFSLVFYLDIFVLHRGIMGKIYLDRTNILIKQCNWIKFSLLPNKQIKSFEVCTLV